MRNARDLSLVGMDGSFDIRVEADRDLVRVRLAGFLDAVLLDPVLADLARQGRLLRCAPGRHVSIVHLRDLKIQSQETVTAFTATLGAPTRRSDRLAVVVGMTLARKQVMRALASRSDRSVAFFTDPQEAERWLFGSEETIAA